MKIHYSILAFCICLFAVISGSYYYFVVSKKCADGEQYSAETKTCVVAEQNEILYSNLGSETANKEVETVLLSAGIPKEDVERFFAQVHFFNDTVGAFEAGAKDFRPFS